jgi:hypothetical protein
MIMKFVPRLLITDEFFYFPRFSLINFVFVLLFQTKCLILQSKLNLVLNLG